MSKHKHRKPKPPQPVPKATTETAVVNNVNDPIPALAALYGGEKTDASAVFNTAIALMALALAYLVGAMPFVEELGHAPNAKLSLVLLPIPLWLVIAFHSLMTLNAMSHGISVRIIEDALFEASELRARRDLVGSAAGDKIMDITQAKVVHKATTVVVYLGVACLVIGFTVYALYSAKGIVKHDVIWVIAIVTYSLLLIMVLLSWIVGVLTINKGRGEISERVESSGANQQKT